jgi:hypothetical protein
LINTIITQTRAFIVVWTITTKNKRKTTLAHFAPCL